MKAVILAGGLGTRLAEETGDKPKPMVEIGGKPIIWHIMKIFECHGINDFIVCCGYKGYYIKDFFHSYNLRHADISFDLATASHSISTPPSEKWTVTCVDTGENTMTGGRLKKVRDYLDPDEPFLFTYGDGVGDINVTELIEFHNQQKKLATVTAVSPPSRFGVLKIDNDSGNVTGFNEKPASGNTWINGGFFVLNPKVIDYIDSDMQPWEAEPIAKIAKDNQLTAYKHRGFWQPMDTLAEKKLLNKLYENDEAPWKSWK
jgi:glucose-1-phosphate cytidylyltransferase